MKGKKEGDAEGKWSKGRRLKEKRKRGKRLMEVGKEESVGKRKEGEAVFTLNQALLRLAQGCVAVWECYYMAHLCDVYADCSTSRNTNQKSQLEEQYNAK